MKLKIVSAVLYSIIILNIAFIFFNSTKNADESGATSEEFTRDIAPYVIADFENKTVQEQDVAVDRLESVIRETAHGVEFFPLGLCSSLLVLLHGFTGKKRLMLLLLCLSGCILCAICDESLQLLSPGRSFQLLDICIDTAGSTAGIIVSCVFYFIFTRKKRQSAV